MSLTLYCIPDILDFLVSTKTLNQHGKTLSNFLSKGVRKTVPSFYNLGLRCTVFYSISNTLLFNCHLISFISDTKLM